jgi:hypothetical protein
VYNIPPKRSILIIALCLTKELVHTKLGFIMDKAALNFGNTYNIAGAASEKVMKTLLPRKSGISLMVHPVDAFFLVRLFFSFPQFIQPFNR